MQLKAAIGSFFVEFSRFEIHSVGMALRSLSKDPVFVEQAEKLLDLEARLKLLERMAFARGIAPALIAELDVLLIRARKVCAERDEVARNSLTVDLDPVKSYAGPPAGKPRLSRVRGTAPARLAEIETLWMPTVAQIQGYTTEAVELRETLSAISEKIDQQLLADESQVPREIE